MLPAPKFLKFAPPGVDPGGIRGVLIAVEGPPWAGVRTQAGRLQRHLEVRGFPAIVCETPAALDGGISETLSSLAALAAMQQMQILPALRAGQTVIASRGVYSWMALQGRAGEWARSVTGFLLRPSATLYLRAPVTELVRRLIAGGGAFPATYESFCQQQQNLLQAFDAMVEPGGFRLIDAGRSKDQVFQDLVQIVSEME